MAKVLLRSTRRAGGQKRVDTRLAEVLVRRGGWEYAEAAPATPAPAAPDPAQPPGHADRSFNDLRRLASERGLKLGRASKAELVAALGELDRGRYGRRDMRAAE